MTTLRRQARPGDDSGVRWPTIIAHGVAALIALMLALTVVVLVDADGDVVGGIPFVVLLAVFLLVGWLIAWRRPENPLGWLLLAVPGLFTLGAPAMMLGEALLDTAPGVATWLLWYGSDREDTWAWLPPIGLLLTQIPLRFPDGRLPSPRWRWFSRITIVVLVASSALLSTASVEVYPGVANPVGVDGIAESPLVLVVFAALGASFLGSLASLVVRSRRAGAVEAAQLRWMLWAVAIIVVVLIGSWLLPDDWTAVRSTLLIVYGLIPAAIAVAVLRYRLFEIDRLISRTASYALVTSIVVGVYATVVTSVGLLLPGASTLGVALATLAAAALFLPALRITRRVLDRRFNRAQYDAARVAEDFGQRLRTGADPHTAPVDLLVAVERTLEPAVVGIWTAPQRRHD
jgi:hypothetical protein